MAIVVITMVQNKSSPAKTNCSQIFKCEAKIVVLHFGYISNFTLTSSFIN